MPISCNYTGALPGRVPGGEKAIAARVKKEGRNATIALGDHTGFYVPSWPATPRDLSEKEDYSCVLSIVCGHVCSCQAPVHNFTRNTKVTRMLCKTGMVERDKQPRLVQYIFPVEVGGKECCFHRGLGDTSPAHIADLNTSIGSQEEGNPRIHRHEPSAPSEGPWMANT